MVARESRPCIHGALLTRTTSRSIHVCYMVDYGLWGLSPFGFHLQSVLLDGDQCGARFALCRSEALRELRSSRLLAALLYAVHPSHVEAIAWVSIAEGSPRDRVPLARGPPSTTRPRRARDSCAPCAYAASVGLLRAGAALEGEHRRASRVPPRARRVPPGRHPARGRWKEAIAHEGAVRGRPLSALDLR